MSSLSPTLCGDPRPTYTAEAALPFAISPATIGIAHGVPTTAMRYRLSAIGDGSGHRAAPGARRRQRLSRKLLVSLSREIGQRGHDRRHLLHVVGLHPVDD